MTRALWVLLLVWIISVTFSLPWLYYNKVSIDVVCNCRKYIIYYKDMNVICLYLTKKLQKKMSHSITTEYTHSLSYIQTYITVNVKMNENVLCIIQPSLQDQIRNLTLGSVSYIIVLYILHTRQQAGNSYYLIYIKKNPAHIFGKVLSIKKLITSAFVLAFWSIGTNERTENYLVIYVCIIATRTRKIIGMHTQVHISPITSYE